jgi:hypothetical protein
VNNSLYWIIHFTFEVFYSMCVCVLFYVLWIYKT